MRKRAICIWLALWLAVVSPVLALAEQQSYGDALSDVMALIESSYSGKTLTQAQLYEAALYGMTQLMDAYSTYISPDELAAYRDELTGVSMGVGVAIDVDANGQVYIRDVLPGSPAAEAGIAKGDWVMEIDDLVVADAELPLEHAHLTLTGNQDTHIRLVLSRDGAQNEYRLEKAALAIPTVVVGDLAEMLAGDAHGVGYMLITAIGANTADELSEAIAQLTSAGVTKLVLDLRGNTGGYLDAAIAVCRQLVPRGTILYARDSQKKMKMYTSDLRRSPFESIAVLTDAQTASAAEILAAALQDSGVGTVVGAKTYGKGVIQTVFVLPAGGALKMTTEEYLRRSGKPVDGVGVTPDIAVEEKHPAFLAVAAMDDGAAILRLKSILDFLGYSLDDPRAEMDPATEDALRAFQTDAGIEPTGALDAETAHALNLAMYRKHSATDAVLLAAVACLAS